MCHVRTPQGKAKNRLYKNKKLRWRGRWPQLQESVDESKAHSSLLLLGVEPTTFNIRANHYTPGGVELKVQDVIPML